MIFRSRKSAIRRGASRKSSARRVDGEHDGAPPLERAPQRERGGDGRLADAAAAGGDDDLVPRDEIGERHGPSAETAARSVPAASSSRDSRSTSARSNSSTKRNGSS